MAVWKFYIFKFLRNSATERNYSS